MQFVVRALARVILVVWLTNCRKTPVTVVARHGTKLHAAVLNAPGALRGHSAPAGRMEERSSPFRSPSDRDARTTGPETPVEACTEPLREAWNDLVDTIGPARARNALDAKDEHGYTALMRACALEDSVSGTACARYLLSLGASATISDAEGFTPMHWAAACSSTEMMEVLVEHGGSVDAPSDDGETPLHRATRLGRVANVEWLMHKGASPTTQNDIFESALDVAGVWPPGKVSAIPRKAVRQAILKFHPHLRTALLHHEDCMAHVAPEGHQESAERIDAILTLLHEKIQPSDLEEVTEFEAASESIVTRAHSRRYYALIATLASAVRHDQQPLPFTPMVQRGMKRTSVDSLKAASSSDTYFSGGSFRAALRAVGSVVHAIDLVVSGRAHNAMCVVRPPGHHAGVEGLLEGSAQSASCGFCIFNSVACGALHALATHSKTVRRVAILDLDVHHGNGTEEIVRAWTAANPHRHSLFFWSVHLHDIESRKRGTGKDPAPPAASSSAPADLSSVSPSAAQPALSSAGSKRPSPWTEAPQTPQARAPPKSLQRQSSLPSEFPISSPSAAESSSRPPSPVVTAAGIFLDPDHRPDLVLPRSSAMPPLETAHKRHKSLPSSAAAAAFLAPPLASGPMPSPGGPKTMLAHTFSADLAVRSVRPLKRRQQRPWRSIGGPVRGFDVGDPLDDEREVAYAFYPGSGADDCPLANVCNCAIPPLWRAAASKTAIRPPRPASGASVQRSNVGRQAVKRAVEKTLLPSLRAFGPDLILISAGFDGSAGDVGNIRNDDASAPSGLNLRPEDYAYITDAVLAVARRCCPGRVVSTLEGGYGIWKEKPQPQPVKRIIKTRHAAKQLLTPQSTDSQDDEKSPTPTYYLDRSNLAEACTAHVRSLVENGVH